MLISPATAAGITDGSVTLAFRRWDRPRMRPGSTQRTGSGIVLIETVDVVDPATLTEDDARRAGVPTLAELRRLLDLTVSLPGGYQISHRGRSYLG